MTLLNKDRTTCSTHHSCGVRLNKCQITFTPASWSHLSSACPSWGLPQTQGEEIISNAMHLITYHRWYSLQCMHVFRLVKLFPCFGIQVFRFSILCGHKVSECKCATELIGKLQKGCFCRIDTIQKFVRTNALTGHTTV